MNKDYTKRKDICKRYEKTRKGFLMRTYRNMLSRVLGIQKKKAHLYKGLSILSKVDFYEWALSNETFNNMFDTWKALGYTRKESPSIDRIEVTKGYDKGNIRWLTHSENSRLGAISKNRLRS